MANFIALLPNNSSHAGKVPPQFAVRLEAAAARVEEYKESNPTCHPLLLSTSSLAESRHSGVHERKRYSA